MNKRLSLKIAIKLASPLHVGGGKGSIGSYSYLQRDQHGYPYWSGSALKGKVRHYAMQFNLTDRGSGCSFSHKLTDDHQVCKCLVCDMLGSAGNAPGRLVFSDLVITQPGHTHRETSFRSGNAIDRYKRVAKDQHLFGIEVAHSRSQLILEGTHSRPQLILEGNIDGFLEGARFEEQKNLLEESIKQIAYIGSSTSRGLGWLEGDISVTQYTPTENQNNVPNNKRMKLLLTPKSPALIGQHNNQSNYRDTLTYIPGHVFRVGLAKSLVARCGSADATSLSHVTPPAADEKTPLFPTLRSEFDQLRITPMTPMGAQSFPMTACTCKYADCESCKCIYWDTLAKQLAYIGTNNAAGACANAETQTDADANTDTNIGVYAETGADADTPFKCPRTGQRSERASGLYYMDEGVLHTISPHTMLTTKSALDRYRGTARDEMLYSMRILAGGAEVTSSVLVNKSPDKHNKHNKMLDEFQFHGFIEGNIDPAELGKLFSDDIYVGARQTSGYGRMAITTAEAPAQDKTADIKLRIERFNDLIPGSTKVYIPITLLSDAQVNLPVLTPADSCIEDYLNAYMTLFEPLLPHCEKSNIAVTMAMAIARVKPWRGFDTSHVGEHLNDICHRIQSGSVFVLEIATLDDGLLGDLLSMQYHGVCSRDAPGFLSQNGFGMVRIADLFHIDYAHGAIKQ